MKYRQLLLITDQNVKILNAREVICVGSEVIVTSSMERTIFWYVSSCVLAEVYQCFEVIYCLHRQGLKVNQANNQ